MRGERIMFRSLRWLFGFGPYPGVHYYDDRVEWVVEKYKTFASQLGSYGVARLDDCAMFVEADVNGKEEIVLKLSPDEYDIKHISSIDYHLYTLFIAYKKKK